MITCICHALSDKELEKIVEESEGSLRKIIKEDKAGTKCGACIMHIKGLCDGFKENNPTCQGVCPKRVESEKE